MRTILVLISMMGLTVIANLLLKTGAIAGSSTQSESISHLFNWWVLLGLLTFGSAGFLYVVVLQWLPLNVAQSFAAAQFVAVILASAWILSEPIGPTQWVGITFIALGIAMVGWSRM